jgi:hypothetical protein
MPAQTKPKLRALAVTRLVRMVVLSLDDCQEEDSQENQVGSEGEDRFHPSSSRVVYQER